MPRLASPPHARSNAPDWSTEGARWPNRDASRFHEAAGVIWHVQRKGTGPVAVLIHGTGASAHSWLALAPHLAARFEVIAFDLPGQGFSVAPPGFTPTRRALSDAVAALLDDMAVEPALMVGHSAGAAVMIDLAVRKLEGAPRLVSVNGALRPFPGAAAVFAPMAAKALAAGGLAASAFAFGARDPRRVERLLEQTGSSPPAESVACYAALLRRSAHVAATLDMMAHWDLADVPRDLERVNAPALFIAGSCDGAVPPEQAIWAARTAPVGRSVQLAGLGHLAHEESPDRVASVIMDFVNKDRDALRDHGTP